jgi:hypothetical protein
MTKIKMKEIVVPKFSSEAAVAERKKNPHAE